MIRSGPLTFCSAAQTILRRPPPDSFVTALHQLSNSALNSGRKTDGRGLTPSEVIKLLWKLRDAAKLLHDGVKDASVVPWLEVEAAGGPIYDYDPILSVLKDLEHRADSGALAVPAGKGNKLSSVRKHPSARLWCALIVSAAWQAAGRPDPSATNNEAHKVAEALWLGSGGPAWAGHAQSVQSWRRYFKQVSAASPALRSGLHAYLKAAL